MRSIKVLTQIKSPFVTKNGEKYSGFLIEVWERVAARLRIDYAIEETRSNPEILDQMVAANGTVAVGLGDFSVGYFEQMEKYKEIEFSSPYLVTGFGAAVYLEEKPSLKSLGLLATSFSLPVWLTFFAMLIINSAAFFLYTMANRRRFASNPESFVDENYGFVESLWFSAGTVLCQQTDHRPKTVSLRAAAVGWFVFCLVFVTFYLAKMASTMTAAAINFRINDINDLPTHEDLRNSSVVEGYPLIDSSLIFYGTKGRIMKNFFEELKEGMPRKTMWPLMENWNTTHFETWGELESFARRHRGRFAMLRKRLYLEDLAASRTECDLFVLSGTLNQDYLGLALSRKLDPEVRSAISREILRLGRQGIIQALRSFYWKKQTCSIVNAEKKMQEAFSLEFENLAGVFFLILLFYIISFFCFTNQILCLRKII